MDFHLRPCATAVKALLAAAALPTEDLRAEHFEHFIACGPEDSPDAVVGLELYGEVALLRSLVVAAAARDKGYGSSLVAQAEAYAGQRGVQEIYLLTTTAEAFFRQLGYASCTRADAPAAIRQTAEFSSLCPANSAFMRKRIEAR
ncbi:arsenic resistance N-acetyltransferase ArsN2 [Pseudomonas sp.]|uniref:arsenic resistance N-acetyltransferase ArsN2 n=1 Tax=Pseudomonas sp. TaxID=306 RepID=UPI00299E11BB|nr:arsenic resistance N-acetyltransferase ArsN2 [Pseudomonas sp.]MDX1370498.1 arsenic resistance N-acetyltransferase ArsN2 [Pseudomonas sp.]